VASSRDRQRRLAREKLDRQLARRAGRERRRRRIMAGVGAGLAVVLILAGVGWLGGMFDSDDKPDPAASDTCLWMKQSAASNPDLKEVGEPPTKDLPTTGTRPMTITTNQGVPITVGLDLNTAPCAGASLAFLAGKQFYDNTECTEITADGALRCGDPKGTGQGGPTYSVYSENTPTAPTPAPSGSASPAGKPPAYPKGTVALIGNPPGTNGSQFLLFFKDFSPATPEYAIVGKITGGMDTLAKISKIPTVDNGSGGKVKPKDKVLIQSLTVGAVAGDAAPSAAPSASGQS
jgi:peptidyl-prolyl cis-trans isomerase B (cyclophilin B)